MTLGTQIPVRYIGDLTMDVVYWEGGLLRHEVEAIEIMAKTFKGRDAGGDQNSQSTPSSSGSMAQQLKQQLGGKHAAQGVLPWKAYAGFRFADARGPEGEFDLVIVTHKNVLIIELKHWHGEITCNAGNWYQNGDERGRSPVAITQNKVFLLLKKLNTIKSNFPENRVPNVQFCVVLSGDCTFNELPDNELKHVLHLKEFLQLTDEKKYNVRFRPHPAQQGLNQYFEVFDSLFNKGNTKPKELIVDGFRAGDLIFEHPAKVYVEYQAKNDNNKDERALLRLWDFSKLDDVDAKTPEGRYKILSRERDVLVYLSQRDLELARRCLRPIKNPSKSSITQEFSELCELPGEHYRLNEFINRYVAQFPESGRMKLAKIMIAQFAAMHGYKVAHRDLGEHSVWFSPSSTIALSNFIAAYHQPAGTVGPRRDQLSIGAIALPEDNEGAVDRGTPFHRDVFALGILCWHLLQAKSLPLKLDAKYVASVREEILHSDAWYAGVLCAALELSPEDRHANAGELLEQLSESTPNKDGDFDFDPAVLERFSSSGFNPYKVYPSDEDILDTEDKEVYRSGVRVVKLWPSLHADTPRAGQGPMLLAFYERLAALQKSGYEFLPEIESFGYGKGGTPFLIQRYVDGPHWNELMQLEAQTSLAIIKQLIAAVECLHEQQISHGDLHPGNVKISLPSADDEPAEIFLLDMPDLCASGTQPVNNRYSPTWENSTHFERDNFAVMRMAIELFGMDWDVPGDVDILSLREAIEHEQGSDSGFLSLERFRDALSIAFSQHELRPSISIEVRASDDFDFTMYPDNGRLFIKIGPDNRNPTQLIVDFEGVGGTFRASYNPVAKTFEAVFSPRAQESARFWVSKAADYELDLSIRVISSRYTNLGELTEFMRQQVGFGELACSISDEARAITSSLVPSEVIDEVNVRDLESNDEADAPQGAEPKTFSVSKIWKAVLETETEALPTVEVVDEPKLHRDKVGLLIPYTAEREVLESFEADDTVYLSKKKDDKTTELGVIDIRKSSKSELYLILSSKAKGIKPEDQLYIQSNSTRTSFTRRKKATERMLERLSVVPNLIDYFDESCALSPELYSEPPTEADFKLYERQVSDNQVIGLNEAQKEAFARLVTRGPIGLLQGPPGTGKTEFIAAFCHYLVSHEGVSNILLVSQSHEAVNTAAERIRAHCRRLDTDLDVVRFSNSEKSVSDELRDVYARAILTQQRESFRAELKHRLALMAPSLGVSSDFIQSLVDAQHRVYGLVRNIERLQKDLEGSGAGDENVTSCTSALKAMQLELQDVLRQEFGLEPELEIAPQIWLERIQEKVANDYGVRSHEMKRCLTLIQLSDDLLERMASERANYDEFLVRSRTLVCGTCVGIGLSHLKLAENRFDWVIIDEAARSSPTELAIAMQVGRRVLLVGDHRQLPPFYQEEHKKGIARVLETHPTSAEFQHVMRSDFERAFESPFGQMVSATLKTQYRMQPAIGDMVSQVFYQGKLETGSRPIPNYFTQSPSALSAICTWLDTGVLDKKAHHQEPNGSNSLFNHAEVNAIIDMLKDIEINTDFTNALLDEMSKTQEPAIGIICMYGDQKKMLRRRFAEQSWSDEFKRLVKIDTVDSYQGKENRIVMLSITRSNPEQSPGFLRSPNRINVALSRAMDRLVIVGDMRMWAGRNAELPLGKICSYIRERQQESDYAVISVETEPARRQSNDK